MDSPVQKTSTQTATVAAVSTAAAIGIGLSCTALLGSLFAAAMAIGITSVAEQSVGPVRLATTQVRIAATTVYRPDLSIKTVTRDEDGTLRLWIQNIGNQAVNKPDAPSAGLCFTVYGDIPTAPGKQFEFGCLNRSETPGGTYPIIPGKQVGIPLGVKTYNGTLRIGIDGTWYDFKTTQSYQFVNRENKIVESNETNNSKDITVADIGDSSTIDVDLTIKSASSAVAGNCTLTGGPNSCCGSADPKVLCTGFFNSEPFIQKATDGSQDSLWCSAKKSTANYSDSFTVDLGTSQDVYGVIIKQPRSFANTSGSPYACSYASDYEIRVSNDGINWSAPIHKVVGEVEKPIKTIAKFNQISGSSVRARYIRLTATKVHTSNGWRLAVNDFRVLGKFQKSEAVVSAPTTSTVDRTYSLDELKAQVPKPASTQQECTNLCTSACDNDPSCFDPCMQGCLEGTCGEVEWRIESLQCHDKPPSHGLFARAKSTATYCGIVIANGYNACNITVSGVVPFTGWTFSGRINVVGSCAAAVIPGGSILLNPIDFVVNGCDLTNPIDVACAFGRGIMSIVKYPESHVACQSWTSEGPVDKNDDEPQF